MNNQLSIVSVFSLCLLGGCSEITKLYEDKKEKLATDDQVLVPPEPGPTCGPPSPTTPADLCPPGRRVGYFPGVAACPSPYQGDPPSPRWEVEQMFVGPKNQQILPEGLGGFCRYVWSDDSLPPTDLPKVIASKVGPDCRTFPQSPMASALRPAYVDAFAQGTQPLPSKPNGGVDVAIAVIDTAPAATSAGQAGHGQAMAAIAGELAGGCVPGLGEPSCARKVSTWLGLPHTRTGPDQTRGGFFGYQSELAEGIAAATFDPWLQQNPDAHLILNLSVGWEPVAGEFDAPTPAVQAIRDALAVAQCKGALIVAASGNKPSGTCFGQATGPGGWEREPGYTKAQCMGLGLAEGEIRVPAAPPAYHPFLHAATPLDWRGGNLPSYRDTSNARVAATGFAGFDEVGGRSYGPISGSSVSTAVVSGVAALVWSYFNGLNADEVMQLVYDSGSVTGGDVDLQFANSGPLAQHQVSACGVLQWACDPSRVADYLRGANPQAPSVCASQALESCSKIYAGGPPEVDVATWSDSFDTALGQLSASQSHSSVMSYESTLQCNQCGTQRITQLAQGMQTEPEHAGWVLPQPYKGACPLCHVKGANLYLSLDPDYDGYAIDTFSVYLYDSAGGTEVLHYSSRNLSAPLQSTSVETMADTELTSVTAGLPPVRAEIVMTFTDPQAAATGSSTTITASNPISVE